MLRAVLLFSLILLSSTVYADKHKVVFITGGLSGIGKEISRELSKKNYKVWATSRFPEKYSWNSQYNVKAIQLDLTNGKSIQKAVQTVLKQDKRIDILINNAGFGILGPDEAVSLEQAREEFEVNFFGPLNLIQEILPSMREKKSGHIINISSTSGIRAVPGIGLYAASKFALEGLSESLAASLQKWNIHVSIIQPGMINNDFLVNCNIAENLDKSKDYIIFTKNLQKSLLKKAKSAQPAFDVAKVVIQAIESTQKSLRYQTSEDSLGTVKQVRNDPTGNLMLSTMTAFSEKLYKSNAEG